jgi:hypothetical protein
MLQCDYDLLPKIYILDPKVHSSKRTAQKMVTMIIFIINYRQSKRNYRWPCQRNYLSGVTDTLFNVGFSTPKAKATTVRNAIKYDIIVWNRDVQVF